MRTSTFAGVLAGPGCSLSVTRVVAPCVDGVVVTKHQWRVHVAPHINAMSPAFDLVLMRRHCPRRRRFPGPRPGEKGGGDELRESQEGCKDAGPLVGPVQ